MDNVHSNHRERMREKYDRFGEGVFETHQLLEMLLFSYISRKDTNPIAHGVLQKLDGTNIFTASAGELNEVAGIGNTIARSLKISADTVRRLICDTVESEGLESDFKRRMYIYLKMMGKPYESVYAATLSPRNKLLDFREVTSKVRMTDEFVSFIVDNAKAVGGKGVILCHSHGNKSAEASVDDLYLTALIRKKLEDSGVELIDHYIVTDTDCVSCWESEGR